MTDTRTLTCVSCHLTFAVMGRHLCGGFGSGYGGDGFLRFSNEVLIWKRLRHQEFDERIPKQIWIVAVGVGGA